MAVATGHPATALQETFRGSVVTPADEGYDAARRVWNGSVDRRPALIARCASPADVISGVRFARELGMALAVRGGGHSIPGHSTCDEGMVLDLSPMQGIRVDPAARTVRAEAGLTWGPFDRETQAFGLAVTGGQVTHTGIAGLTLGGGIGWLMRKFGLTCDSLLSADVVTADGELVKASADENEDLFWGLRGGGGNFGVVTSFEYRLHELGPVYAGAVLHPRERAGDALRRLRDFAAEAPDEVTPFAVLMTAPPAPFVPDELKSRPAIALAACYAGPPEEGEQVLRPLREFGPPAADLFQPMPYTVIQSMFDESAVPGRSYYISGNYFHELSDELIETVLAHGERMAGPRDEIHVGQLGGAIARVPEDATAYGRRDAAFNVTGIAAWEDPAAADAEIAWSRGLAAAVRPLATGTYTNFLGEEGLDRIRFSYGDEKWQRLVALKRKYDPDNVFCLNQNIPPG